MQVNSINNIKMVQQNSKSQNCKVPNFNGAKEINTVTDMFHILLSNPAGEKALLKEPESMLSAFSSMIVKKIKNQSNGGIRISDSFNSMFFQRPGDKKAFARLKISSSRNGNRAIEYSDREVNKAVMLIVPSNSTPVAVIQKSI